MASTPTKPLVNWLQHQSDHLDGLLDQIRLLRRITNVIRSTLPESLASHCHAANFDDGILVVGCDSSTWAAKLRYQLPQLLSQLQNQPAVPGVAQIRIRVQPLARALPASRKRRFLLSEQSAALITGLADHIDDPELKAALRRLGQRAKPH